MDLSSSCALSWRTPPARRSCGIIKRLEVVEAFRQSGNKPEPG